MIDHEQKNYTHVRQLVGYDRLEGREVLEQLQVIYGLARVWWNGWLPVMKLTGKEREGAKVTKHYDEPKTPYRRALDAQVVSDTARLSFDKRMAERGPLGLKRQLDTELEQLWRLKLGVPQLTTAIG